MPRPEHHIFVCVARRPDGHPRGSCGAKGSQALQEALGRVLISRNLLNRVALTGTTCLGPCQAGANVLIYPAGTLYSWVEPGDAETLVEHLLKGETWPDKLTPAEIW